MKSYIQFIYLNIFCLTNTLHDYTFTPVNKIKLPENQISNFHPVSSELIQIQEIFGRL